MIDIPAYISIFGGVIGFIGLIAGAVFYVRFTATKSNLEGKDETIDTLEKSRDTYRDRSNELEKEVAGLRAENKALREIATQTPEIIQLTKVVSTSVESNNKVASNVAKLTQQMAKYFKEIKLENHE